MAGNDTFDATDYFLTHYGDLNAKDRVQFQLNKLHDLFQATFSTDQRSLKVLDHGCGQHIISAAANASEVMFCYISSLEGKGEKEARETAEKGWQDRILSEMPMEKGYEGRYDVILECGCLDAACADKESYRRCMKVLTSLWKPSGTFVRYFINGIAEYEQQAYCVGNQTFHCICFNYE